MLPNPKCNPSTLFLRSEFSDVTFRVQNRIFPAHICIVTQSDYLKNLITGIQKKTIIDLSGIEAEMFKILLGTLYGIKPNLNEMDIKKIATICDMSKTFLINDLSKASEDFLRKCVTFDNILNIFQLACSKSLDSLLNICIEEINEDPFSIIRLKDFHNLSPAALKRLISLDTLSAPEVEIFRSVQKWIKFNRDVNSGEDILDLIRWNKFSDDDFLNDVFPSKLVSDSKILQLMFENRFPTKYVDRILSVRNLDHCLRLKPDSDYVDQESNPSFFKDVPYRSNTLNLLTYTLPRPCMINTITIRFPEFVLNTPKIYLHYSDKIKELKDIDEVKFEECLPGKCAFEKSFHPTTIRQIRIGVLRGTYEDDVEIPTVEDPQNRLIIQNRGISFP